MARLRCPDPQCDTFLSPTMLQCVLDEQQFERYRNIHTYIHTLVQLNPGGVSAAVLVMHWSVSACIHVHMCVHAHVYVHVRIRSVTDCDHFIRLSQMLLTVVITSVLVIG